MTDGPTRDKPRDESSRRRRILQSIGAAIVTALAFYYLFGIPAYLLFKDLFG
jgi:hypothetical protein